MGPCTLAVDERRVNGAPPGLGRAASGLLKDRLLVDGACGWSFWEQREVR